jgi:hypothetical protein
MSKRYYRAVKLLKEHDWNIPIRVFNAERRPVKEEICDRIWAEIVKRRAGYKSEYTRRDGSLHAHHLVGKPCYRLRYELDNGICLTAGEHKFVAHHTGRAEQFRDFVKSYRGKDTFEKLNLLRRLGGKTRLQDVYLYLLNELRKTD